MKKPILYSDFDGVIYDTINTAFSIMKDNNCDMSNGVEIDRYFRELLDWEEVYKKATIINDSIEKLKLFQESKIFQDVIILTKLSGNYHEERIKRDFLNIVLPSIKVITLQYGLAKSSVVKAIGNILIDDELKNCLSWKKSNGVAILFNQEMCDLENDIVSDILDIPNTSSVKKLMKTYKY